LTDSREATEHRRALLTAALGFLQPREEPAEVATLRRYMDTWTGLGDVITGLTRQGWDVELRQGQDGWRAYLYPTGLAHSIRVAAALEPTPWQAVQQAGWAALYRDA
jgi:hypothetical protein